MDIDKDLSQKKTWTWFDAQEEGTLGLPHPSASRRGYFGALHKMFLDDLSQASQVEKRALRFLERLKDSSLQVILAMQ